MYNSFALALFFAQLVVEANYIFSIHISAFSNPGNRLANGSCCNGTAEEGICVNTCEVILQFCVRAAEHPQNDTDACPTLGTKGNASPRVINPGAEGPWEVNSFHVNCGMHMHIDLFPSPSMAIKENYTSVHDVWYCWPPYTHTSKGSAQMLIGVTESGTDQLIDNIFIELNLTANDPFIPLESFTGLLDQATIDLQFRIMCAFDYFGMDCNSFCVGKNNTDAHYSCGEDGEMVCLQGYQNESSNCTQCAPAEGCCMFIPMHGHANLDHMILCVLYTHTAI